MAVTIKNENITEKYEELLYSLKNAVVSAAEKEVKHIFDVPNSYGFISKIMELEKLVWNQNNLSFDTKQKNSIELYGLRNKILDSKDGKGANLLTDARKKINAQVLNMDVVEKKNLDEIVSSWVYLIGAQYLVEKEDEDLNSNYENYIQIKQIAEYLIEEYSNEIENEKNKNCVNCERQEEEGCGVSEKNYSVCSINLRLGDFEKEKSMLKDLIVALPKRFYPDFKKSNVSFLIEEFKKKVTSKYSNQFYDGFVVFKRVAKQIYDLAQEVDTFFTGAPLKYNKLLSDAEVAKIQADAQKQVKFGSRKISASEEKKLFDGTNYLGYIDSKIFDLAYSASVGREKSQYLLNLKNQIFEGVKQKNSIFDIIEYTDNPFRSSSVNLER